jgi:glutaredoxin
MICQRLAAIAVAGVLAAGAAQAQVLYRWTDAQGGVHITDTPPPANARNVRKLGAAAPGRAPAPSDQQPYELVLAQKEFPVTLYTAPQCGEPCAQARAALNRRGVPFSEVLVADAATREELKRVADGAEEVPVLFVGRSVHKGFQQEAFDALLDAARYPRTGLLPPRAQAAPKPQPPSPPPEEEAAPSGPYTPRFSK